MDMLTFAAGEDDANKFRPHGLESAPETLSAMESLLPQVADPVLAHALSKHVGYVFEGQRSKDRAAVEALFSLGCLGAVIVTSSCCWGLGM